MGDSILITTKKLLGLSADYTAFDLDVITHINSAFGTLTQLGVGPTTGFMIEDADNEWNDFAVPADQIVLVKTYIYLKTRLVFDPPSTSFVIEALNQQLKELEWRLNMAREIVTSEEVIV